MYLKFVTHRLIFVLQMII